MKIIHNIRTLSPLLIIKKIHKSTIKKVHKLEGGTVFILSYLLAILLGGLLLWLPFSHPRMEVSFLDAVFTSTSALCVTGLTVMDTGTHFSFMGQIVILLSGRR